MIGIDTRKLEKVLKKVQKWFFFKKLLNHRKNEIDSPGPENGSTFVNIGTMKKGLSISWENITARTKNNRVILNEVSGEFPAFSLSAIMGRSGSGKGLAQK